MRAWFAFWLHQFLFIAFSLLFYCIINFWLLKKCCLHHNWIPNYPHCLLKVQPIIKYELTNQQVRVDQFKSTSWQKAQSMSWRKYKLTKVRVDQYPSIISLVLWLWSFDYHYFFSIPYCFHIKYTIIWSCCFVFVCFLENGLKNFSTQVTLAKVTNDLDL